MPQGTDKHNTNSHNTDTPETPQEASEPALENIAGIWRRSAAFALDAAILIAAGSALGYAAFDTLAAIGPWGRALGLLVSLAYFGLSDSNMGKAGKAGSPGKRLLGLSVVDRTGSPIPPVQALLRSLIFLIPVMIDARCITCPAPIEAALGSLIYGAGGALITLYVINTQTRQSLHDLVAGTFVIRAASLPTEPVTKSTRLRSQLLVAGAVALTISAFIIMATVEETKSGRRTLMAEVVKTLSAEPEVGSAQALSGHLVVKKKPVGFVQITVRLKKRPEHGLEHESHKLVNLAMREVPEAFKVNTIGARISYGYDIGISVRYETKDGYASPAGWKKRIASDNKKP